MLFSFQVDLSALAQMLAKYLPLTGGTLTGDLGISEHIIQLVRTDYSLVRLNTQGQQRDIQLENSTGRLIFSAPGYGAAYIDNADFVGINQIITSRQTPNMAVLSSEICKGVYAASSAGNSIQLPGWGSWAYFMGGAGPYMQANNAAGGTVLSLPNAPVYLLAVRFG